MADQVSTDADTNVEVPAEAQANAPSEEVSNTDAEAINDILADEDDTPVETKAPTEDKAEDPAEPEEDAEEETEDSDEADEEQQPIDEAEAKREAYKQREAARRERESALAENNSKYIEEAQDEQDRALRELQVEAYRTRVESNESKLINSFDRAVSSIDVFKNPSPEVKEYLDNAIDSFQAQYVRVDNQGNPIEVTGDLYEHLNKHAEIVRNLQQVGARQGKADTAKTRNSAVTPPAKSPPKPKVDPTMQVLLSDD